MAAAPDEAERYRAFVERSLEELRCGLALDNPDEDSKKGHIVEAFRKQKAKRKKGTHSSAAQLVLEGRFLLGADDSAYLSSGLGLLWSTVGNGNAQDRTIGAAELELAPASLYMPEATNGIRKGLLRALKAKHAEASKGDKQAQLRVFLKALRPFLGVEDIRREVDPDNAFATAIGAYDADDASAEDSAATLKALALGLVRFKRLLQAAHVGSGSLADQILKAQSVQVKAIQAEAEKAMKRRREELELAKAELLEAMKARTAAEKRYAAQLEKERKTSGMAQEAAKRCADELKLTKAEMLEEIKAKVAAEKRCDAELENASKAYKALETQLAVALSDHERMTTEARNKSEEAMQQLRAGHKLQIDDLNEQLAKAQAAAAASLDTVPQSLHDKKIVELMAKITSLKGFYGELTAKYQDMEGLYKATGEELEKSRDALKISRQETDEALKLKPKLALFEAAVSSLKSTNEQLTAKVEELQAALAKTDQADQVFQAANEKMAQAAAMLQKAQGEKKTADEKEIGVANVLTKLAALEAQVALAEKERDECNAKLGRLQVQEKILQDELAKSDAERVASLARQKELEAQVQALREELVKCDEDYEQLKAKLVETERQKRLTIAQANTVLALNKPNSPLVRSTLQRVRDARNNKANSLAQDTQKQLAAELAEAEAQVEVVVDDIKQRVEEQEAGIKVNPVSSLAMMQLVADVAEMKEADDVLVPAQSEAIKDAITRTSEMVETVMVETAVTGMAEEQGIGKEKAREVIKATILTPELKGKGLVQYWKDKAKTAALSVLASNTTYAVLSLGTQALIGYWLNPTATVADVASNPETWREWAWNALESAGKSAAGFDPTSAKTLAPYDADPDVATAVLRGLVGQRGPTEPGNIGHCPQDALLPYALPSARELGKIATTVRHVLENSSAPTCEDVLRAECVCRARLTPPPPPTDGTEPAKRPRLAPPIDAVDGESLVTTAEAFAALGGNYAITGVEPARADDARKGVEMPHEVRWMPQGPRAETMARVAVLEHSAARCAQVATRADTPAPVARALRGAAAALKLRQLEPLYALKEAAAFEDEPHPLGTEAPLVTRPCAVVRGVLSFPTDSGVAPRPAQVGSGKPGTDTANLEQAMGKTAADTATLRNRLRREKAASHFYVAPPADALAFHEAATGATARATNKLRFRIRQAAGVLESTDERIVRAQSKLADATLTDDEANNLAAELREAMFPKPVEEEEEVDESVDPLVQSVDQIRILANRALVLVAGEWPGDGDEPPDAVSAYLDAEALEDDAGAVTAQTRRDGLWTEFQRHLAISQDRLWIFVRLMSGCIGGDVSEVITMADEATLAATRAVQQQRADISKRVSDMQTKIVETVVGSMLKSSGLTLDYDKDHLTVINGEAKKKLDELASGTSGRPFFEANVALRNLSKDGERATPTLSQVLKSLAAAGTQMQATLEGTLQEPGTGAASLAELSHPTNSYFVALRPDSTAAIREAQERLNVELVLQGGARRMALWELVEGGCAVLTNRFADFCGFLLVQKRSSTGVSAMYVSQLSIRTNASQARVSLARLVAAACAYAARVPAPRFIDHDDAGDARKRALTAAEAVQDSDVVARPITLVRNVLAAPVHPSGWSVM